MNGVGRLIPISLAAGEVVEIADIVIDGGSRDENVGKGFGLGSKGFCWTKNEAERSSGGSSISGSSRSSTCRRSSELLLLLVRARGPSSASSKSSFDEKEKFRAEKNPRLPSVISSGFGW